MEGRGAKVMLMVMILWFCFTFVSLLYHEHVDMWYYDIGRQEEGEWKTEGGCTFIPFYHVNVETYLRWKLKGTSRVEKWKGVNPSVASTLSLKAIEEWKQKQKNEGCEDFTFQFVESGGGLNPIDMDGIVICCQ